MKEAQKTYSHYDLTRNAIKNYTGLKNRNEIDLVMVRLFQIHYLNTMQKLKKKALKDGILNVLQKIKKSKSFSLVLVSGIEPFTIKPALKILNMEKLFDQVICGSFASGFDNLKLIKKVKGKISLVIGDRAKDLIAGKKLKAKTCLVTWGQYKKEDKKYADFIARKPDDILRVMEKIK